MDSESAFVQSKDKVILSDLLFYVYNGFLNHPKSVVVETCAAFYDEDAIWKEKTRFYDAIGKKATPRRSSDRKNKNVEDILNEIETRDAANIFLPTFAATRLHNIPQTPDGAVTNAQIMGCLANLRRDIAVSIRSGRQPHHPATPGRRLPTPSLAPNSPSFSSPSPIFTLAQEANQSTTASAQSAPASTVASTQSAVVPMQFTVAPTLFTVAPTQSTVAPTQSTMAPTQSTAALTQSTAAMTQSTAALTQSTAVSSQSIPASIQSTPASTQSTVASTQSTATSTQSMAASMQPTAALTQLATSYSTAAAAVTSLSAVATGAQKKDKANPRLGEMRKPRRPSTSLPKSRKPLLIGKKVSDGTLSWKGADLTTNYYVGRVNNAVDPKMIIDDVESLGVRVVEFEPLKLSHSRFKSFRLCIRKADIPKLLVEDFWPEDVIIDRFFWPKNAKRGALTPTL